MHDYEKRVQNIVARYIYIRQNMIIYGLIGMNGLQSPNMLRWVCYSFILQAVGFIDT